MGLPNKLSIMGTDYNVIYCDGVDVNPENDEDLLGYIDLVAKEIRVSQEQEDKEIWKCLWHEILHGVFYELDIKHRKTSEERLVNLISLAIRNILFDLGMLE